MKPSKEYQTRHQAAKQWRDEVRPLLREFYSFAAPGREDEFERQKRRNNDETTRFHSLGEECAQDLAGDLVNYFTPPEARWFQAEIVTPVPEQFARMAIELAEQRENDIASAIAASNYYDIAPQITFEATHGTAAVWVQQAHMAQPIFFETVPPAELLITPGHLGLLDRFREQWVQSSTIETLLNGYDVTLSDKIKRRMDQPSATSQCTWAFWLNWTDPGRPVWNMEIVVDGERVTEENLILGDIVGACPLLVGRFNPQPRKPWGRGPGLKSLPDMRVLDKVEEIVLLGAEDAMKTTLIYSGDAGLDLSEGITPGNTYPADRRFTRDQIYELNKSTNIDVGFYTRAELEGRIRQAFFQDGPRQRGDTPPTATQWQDERRRVQQRLGKPSAPLWSELYGPLLQRVEYLAALTGLIEPVLMLDGKAVITRPISPLQKAQNLDDVMIARANLELAAGASAGMEGGPAAFVDLRATFTNIVSASGDRLTVIAEEQAPEQPAPAPV